MWYWVSLGFYVCTGWTTKGRAQYKPGNSDKPRQVDLSYNIGVSHSISITGKHVTGTMFLISKDNKIELIQGNIYSVLKSTSHVQHFGKIQRIYLQVSFSITGMNVTGTKCLIDI